MMTNSKRNLVQTVVVVLLTALILGCGNNETTGEPTAEHNASPVQSDSNCLITIGMDIKTIDTLMTNAEFKETMLAMGTNDADIQLKMWDVGDGVFIVAYRKTDSISTNLEYRLITNGPKSTRQEFALPAIQFNTKTEEMLIDVDPEHKNAE
jgi:hypothetical protein